MQNASVERAILDFIVNELPAGAKFHDLRPEDPLLDDAMLDSAAVLEILTYCERLYEVEIPDKELTPGNFESVRAIAAMVVRLQQTQSSGRLRRWLRRSLPRRA
jgi:acyl carrier protein